MTIYEQFLELLDRAIQEFGSANQLAEHLGVPTNRITRWKNRERIPQLDTIQPIIDAMNAQLVSGGGQSVRNVRFVNAHIVDAENAKTPPQEKDYLAAPILGEVGAGPGVIPESEIKGWFMVPRSVVAGRGLHDLIAVEIAPRSVSMKPKLSPGDIVVVDRDDKDVSTPGNMMLVYDPVDSSGMVKRVSVREEKGDALITFYSENASQYPPKVYSLMKDFGGEWHNAIVGKVIWAWTDMRGK